MSQKPHRNHARAQLPTISKSPGIEVKFRVVGPDEDEWSFNPERHLEMVQMLAEDGVEFFIAGFWSSHFGGSLEYIDQNDLLMVSPSSTVPAFALPARA